MNVEPGDRKKFERLHCGSLLQLACIAPASYEDRRLHAHVLENIPQVVDATVERITRTPKTYQITLFCHNLGFAVDAVLFRPRPYMLKPFVVSERGYYYGKIEFRAGHAQMAHPQKVEAVGALTARYKTPLRNDTMLRLMARYLSPETLRAEGLPETYAQAIMRLHRPETDPPYGSQALMPPECLEALKYCELLDYMRRLRSKRRSYPALHALSGSWRNWAQALPFELTGDQCRAIEAVEHDLAQSVAARRMVVGDVGSGKTMVILASALMARPHRSILMAPTTILANQLFEEASRHVPMLKSVLVTNRSAKTDLAPFDFIIGTHALLYRDLPDAALVMVDEQHRFGTRQRQQLQSLLNRDSHHPHFLQFSATPIPRTQAMIDSAQIDVSLIAQTPFEKKIRTEVIRKPDFAALMAHIASELDAAHQVLIVYPLVQASDAVHYQSLEEARGFWETRFEKVFVTHGKDREKEAVLRRFRDEGGVLLSTTVVEVGISLPRLSTVVIVGAERLGLSTLHQLRGRVSRTGLRGYCFLFTHAAESERLEAFGRCTNGFDIAALDLNYRQSGDLLEGKAQSGRAFVWVDLAEDEALAAEVKAKVQAEEPGEAQ